MLEKLSASVSLQNIKSYSFILAQADVDHLDDSFVDVVRYITSFLIINHRNTLWKLVTCKSFFSA